MKSTIAVILVTYNAQPWIENCLNSIICSTVETAIIIVDNNSCDTTLEIIENQYPAIILIKNVANQGFGKGNNIGIRYALENGYDYVALLNQDAKLHKDSLEKLMGYSSKYPDYGILAPLIFSYDGNALDPYHVAKSFTGNLKLSSDVYFHREDDVYDIELAPAAVWLMKADAIREVGGFESLFFMYGEDNDLWERFKRRGWKAGIFPTITAYHHHDPSAWKQPGKRILYTYSEFVLELKNPQNKFFPALFKIVIKNAFMMGYSLLTLNMVQLKILWFSNSKLMFNLLSIYKHRKMSITHKSPFL